MGHFLFITWHGGGNVPPAVGIAQVLKERGHTVTFAGYESQRQRIMDRGFPFACIDTRNWMDLPLEQRLSGEVEVSVCSDHLRQVPDLVAREQVDAVLVDCMMQSALAAVENLSLPYAVLVHTIPGCFAPDSPWDQFLMESINAIRANAGRPVVSSSWEAWSSAPAICATLPELDPLAGQVPPSFRYVGPVFERVPPSDWQSPWPADDPRPLVLVSFSTHNQWDETSRINRTLQALPGDHYRALVTSGMAEIEGILKPGNAVVTHYLPHGEVLPLVKMAVIHAGHGTVTNSLAHGVPMVCLPNPYSDQPMLAAQVEALGAGLALDGDNATVEEIARAVKQVMSGPSYLAAAKRLAGAIKAAQGGDRAASMLEQLL
jgi:UDP:flavonoid glycosyltransferase YjiC (YdhE family)